VVFYVLVLAGLNLGLGFGVAVYLGRRYRSLMAAIDGWDDPGTIAAPPEEVAYVAEESPPDVAPTTEEPTPAESHEAAAAAAAELPPEEPPREKSAAESSIESFQLEAERYLDRVSEADAELRAIESDSDPAALKESVDELLAANDEFRDKREQALEEVEEAYDAGDETADETANETLEQIRDATDLQDEQIARIAEAAETLDYEEDPEVGARQVVELTGKLIGAGHEVRDVLDATMVEVARDEEWLDDANPLMHSDALTGLPSRAGLETHLAEWWQQDPHRVRPLLLALIDLDDFTAMNVKHGQKLGDRVLRAVAQFLDGERINDGPAARFSGQCFAILFPDCDSRMAVNAVENIRQSIEIAQFTHRQSEVQVTVSAGLVDVNEKDTSDTLFDRAVATLQEAKRYGRNRTFVHAGEHPTPVVPPNLSLDKRQITL